MNRIIGQIVQKVSSVAPLPNFSLQNLKSFSPIIPLFQKTPSVLPTSTPQNFMLVLNKKGKVVKKKHARKQGKHVRIRFRG